MRRMLPYPFVSAALFLLWLLLNESVAPGPMLIGAVLALLGGRAFALLEPGSARVRLQAEEEGLDKVFTDAGFEWRLAGCSMCLGMNPDQLAPGERCAATSNRNFEGRMGRGGRTHLMSPVMAAAAAITGHLTDVREMLAETA